MNFLKNQQIYVFNQPQAVVFDWSQYYFFLKIAYLESVSTLIINNNIFFYSNISKQNSR